MCLYEGEDRGREQRVASAYRRQRAAGGSADSAFMAAVREFAGSHPDSGLFAVLGAVKDILSAEPDTGIVDCGGV